MGESDDTLKELEERARKRESIGLSPHRPTAKEVIQSPPDAKRGVSSVLLLLVALAAIAAVAILWRPSVFSTGPFGGGAPATIEEGRLIARDDFAEPLFSLPVGSDEDSDRRYVGDLYRIRVGRLGGRAWATLSQPNLGAYRLEADLRLASQDVYTWGYGGLIARYQNDESFYHFVVDSQGQYQIELAEKGAWRTVRPWTKTTALANGR